jgi:hypothetical protein
LAWIWWDQLRNSYSIQGNLLPQMPSTLIGSFLTVLVICLAIAPWAIRNYRALGTFVPLNTNSGYAFFWGNHPIYGTNKVGILPADGPSYQELIPPELRHLNEAELDRALLKEGLRFVADDPLRYASLSVSRIREYFEFWRRPESSLLSNLARMGSFDTLLPFIGYRLVLSLTLTWRTRNAQQKAVILLLVLFCVVYTGIHLLTWALIRYRLPVDAIFLIFAAIGIVDLSARMRPHRQSDSFLTL